MEQIRILIVDDHAVVREGLRTMIASQPVMTVVEEASDGDEAVVKVRVHKPDVVLMDLVMPKRSGIEAIREIHKESPDTRILVLTGFAQEEQIFPALKAGATGYLLKDSSPQRLIQAIYDIYRGEPPLHPSIALKLIRELSHPVEEPSTKELLSEREITVLRLVAQGRTNQQIADELVVSEWTVRTHVRNILAKLHLANRTQATLYALREGLAALDPQQGDKS